MVSPHVCLRKLACSTVFCLLMTGCHHKKQPAPQPPPPATHHPRPTAGDTDSTSTEFDTTTIDSELATAPAGYFDDISSPPVFTEVGLASWYVSNYRGRPMADGTMGNAHTMTAAHRTLPLGTTARITNLSTGQQVLVRITDRGPFVPGRVLDLSQGAAKAIGLLRAGIANVRVEGYYHATTFPEGHWAVQTGAFKTEGDALDLKAALIRRYRGAQVSEFPGATGFWVRIDPARRDKASAAAIERWIGSPDKFSQAYLIRTD